MVNDISTFEKVRAKTKFKKHMEKIKFLSFYNCYYPYKEQACHTDFYFSFLFIEFLAISPLFLKNAALLITHHLKSARLKKMC